jgi:hypothetical protein
MLVLILLIRLITANINKMFVDSKQAIPYRFVQHNGMSKFNNNILH